MDAMSRSETRAFPSGAKIISSQFSSSHVRSYINSLMNTSSCIYNEWQSNQAATYADCILATLLLVEAKNSSTVILDARSTYIYFDYINHLFDLLKCHANNRTCSQNITTFTHVLYV